MIAAICIVAVLAPAPARLAIDHPGATRLAAADGLVTHASGFLAGMGSRDPEIAARLFLDRYQADFGLAGQELVLLSAPPPGAAGAVKFGRNLDGLPLFGGGVTVGVDQQQRVFLYNGANGPGAVSGKHLIGEANAQQVALAALPGAIGVSEGTIVAGYRAFPGGARAVYRVDFIAQEPPGDWRSYVDGETGKVLSRHDLRARASAPGSVYQVSPAETSAALCPLASGSEAHTFCASPVAVTMLNLNDATQLLGAQTSAYNCNGANAPSARSTLLANCTAIAAAAGGGFQFPVDTSFQSLTDNFAGGMAYFHLDKHVTFFKSLDPTLPPADPTDPGHPLALRGSLPGLVNNLSGGKPFENAFYSPGLDAMVFGQGASADYAYDATIMYHEFTHGVVAAWGGYEETIDDLGGYDEPGGLNEGTADSMAVSETGHSALAAFVGALDSPPASDLREMDDPSAARSCKGNGTVVENFGGVQGINGVDGEVHDDGEIWNGFYWEVFDGLRGTGFKGCNGACEAGPEMMYKTIQLAAGTGPGFATYWKTFKSAAATLHPTQPSVAAYADCVARRRGFDQCDRTVPVFAGETKNQNIRVRFSPFQVALQVTGPATFEICDNSGFPTTIYQRKGTPVELTAIDPTTGAATVTADSHTSFTAKCSSGVEVLPIGVTGAGTYYLLVESPNTLTSSAFEIYQLRAAAPSGSTAGFAPRLSTPVPPTCTPPAPFVFAANAGTPPRGKLTLSTTGGTGTGQTWSITTNHSGASIVADTGVYTAGPTPGVTDTIAATDSLGDSATQTVVVGPGVSVAPGTAAVLAGGTAAFTASGGSGTFTWLVSTNASGGTVDGAGHYAAGADAGTDVVRATDSLGNSGTASVTVTLPVVVDAGQPDAGSDAGQVDAGAGDAGHADAGFDAGVADGGSSGSTDAGAPSGGTGGAAGGGSGGGCSTTGASGLSIFGALAAMLYRRKQRRPDGASSERW